MAFNFGKNIGIAFQLVDDLWTEKQKNHFCGKSANSNLNFLRHFCINF